MALSVFADKSKKPSPKELDKALGRSRTHWSALVTHIAAEYPPLDESWGFAGANWGWALRLKQRKRTVLYMTPCERHFLVGFALGERAVKAARESELPDSVLAVIDEARKYAEGRAVRLEVRNARDLANVKQVAAVKMAS